MPRKLLFIFGGALILAALLLVGFFFLRGKPAPSTNENSNSSAVLPNVNTIAVNSTVNQNTNQSTNGSALSDREEVERIARSFASIYGSFSTQNNFENITDLYFYMTDALKADQERYVAAERVKRTDTSLYKGITSEPRIVDVESMDAEGGAATAKVTLQRTEAGGTAPASKPYYQDLTLTFSKVQGAWKVGTIAWGAKR